jgi:hypothetical protein
MKAGHLDRLLRSAAAAPDSEPPEMPFGFDTRVVALWRGSGAPSDSAADVARFIWRVGAVAAAVLTLATVGAYQQFKSDQWTSLATNEYAIAESPIQTEFVQ